MNFFSTLSPSTAGFRKTIIRISLAVLATYALLPGLYAQCGVLTNASFESGITGWTTNSSTSYGYNTSLYIADGSRSLWIAPRRSGNTGRVHQNYKAKEGYSYVLNFYAGVHNPAYNQRVSLEFYNSSNALLLRETVDVNHNVHPTNLLAPYSLSAVAPANTDIVRVVGTANGDYLKLDYMCLAETAVSFPVEWLEFTVKAQDDHAVLNWITASELNASHFEVQRSVDKLSYERIGEVQASGTSQVVNEYQFTDRNLAAIGMQTFYYRLRQVDFDGSHDFSNVVELSLDRPAAFTLKTYPNPARTQLIVSLQGATSAAELRIINATGQEMYHMTVDAGALSRAYTVDVSNWPSGAYWAMIKGESTVTSQMILKQ